MHVYEYALKVVLVSLPLQIQNVHTFTSPKLYVQPRRLKDSLMSKYTLIKNKVMQKIASLRGTINAYSTVFAMNMKH